MQAQAKAQAHLCVGWFHNDAYLDRGDAVSASSRERGPWLLATMIALLMRDTAPS
jgi:hypothetical protein